MEIIFPGGLRVYALYQGFTIKTDQPKEAGGEGRAPSPFSLFLASLGTCAGFYVLSFCQTRKIPADKIKLSLDFEKNAETKMIKQIKIEIKLPKDFPEKYKEPIIKAAQYCVVAKHIYNPPEIIIETKIE